MNILLYILSLLLRTIILPVSIVYGVIKNIFTLKFAKGYKEINSSFLEMSVAVDKYGGVVCKKLFNDVLLNKKSVYPFGNIWQTVSAVLGLNYKAETLSHLGIFINNSLNNTVLLFSKDKSGDRHTVQAAKDYMKYISVIEESVKQDEDDSKNLFSIQMAKTVNL